MDKRTDNQSASLYETTSKLLVKAASGTPLAPQERAMASILSGVVNRRIRVTRPVAQRTK